jgi:DNA-binding NarL/FixJ family response regulator/Flp pilus assembly pilin Flp
MMGTSDMPSSDAVRVLVVDDHPAVRAGIANLIDGEHPRLCTVGAAASMVEALELAEAHQPNVVVLDVDLAGHDGLALIPALLRAARCEVVVLSSLADAHLCLHARQLGARACVNKTAPATELLDSILEASLLAMEGASAVAPGLQHDRAAPGLHQDRSDVMGSVRRFVRGDEAVTAIEYGLLAALIVVTCIAAFTATGASLSAMYVFWTAAVLAAL